MPCDALVSAGQGASLLVHEATIEDDMPEVARAKGHSTFGQAIDVATRYVHLPDKRPQSRDSLDLCAA